MRFTAIAAASFASAVKSAPDLCMYVYVCVFVCVCVCVYVCVWVDIYVCKCVYIHIYRSWEWLLPPLLAPSNPYMHTLFINLYIRVFVNIYKSIHTHTRTHTYALIHMCV